jgi:hypothetical protein
VELSEEYGGRGQQYFKRRKYIRTRVAMSQETQDSGAMSDHGSATATQEGGRQTQATQDFLKDLLQDLPAQYRGEIDLETWGRLSMYDKLVEPTDAQTLGHLAYLTVAWEKDRIYGRDLWNIFFVQ